MNWAMAFAIVGTSWAIAFITVGAYMIHTFNKELERNWYDK